MRVIIGNQEYEFFGNVRGANNNKWNRVAKLAQSFNELDSKFAAMVERGNYVSQTARCAVAVRMLMHTGIRVGNEASAEGYLTKPHPNDKTRKPEFVKTYGLTTLMWEHLQIGRKYVQIAFCGKRSIENAFKLNDSNLVTAISELSTYETETVFDVSYSELVKFIRRYVGVQYTPKDFRTLRANMYAWEYYWKLPYAENVKEVKSQIKEICEYVADKLNNTPAVCKKSYIDDGLFDYMTNS